MGGNLVRASISAILARYGEDGMTLQEIIEKDRKIFHFDMEHVFSEKDPSKAFPGCVVKRGDQYFLKPGAASIEWAENTIQNALAGKVAESYDPRQVVKVWGESLVLNAFGLVETGDPKLPDQKSEDGSFYVEVKTSAFDNGGVIKGRQLAKFDKIPDARRFYAFVFHTLTGNMGRTYPNEERLYAALTLQSLHIMPYSVVDAHFDASKKKPYPPDDVFVQLNEKHAKHIFSGDYGIWKISLDLNPAAYSRRELHPRVKLITRNNDLEEEIVKSFDPEVIDSAARLNDNESH